MYWLSIPTGTINGLVTKTVSNLHGQDAKRHISHLFYRMMRTTAPFSVLIGVLLIIFSSPLATIFKANQTALIVLGVSSFFSLIQTIIGSFVTALQKFVLQTILGFVNITVLLALSYIFISKGWGATGAVLAQIIAGILVSILTAYFIWDYIRPSKKTENISLPKLNKITLYSFLFSVGTMSMMSTDILIVRAVFSPEQSGLYSALSVLARMLLYGLTPLGILLLSLISYRRSAKKGYLQIFFKLLLATIVLGLVGVAIFTSFPMYIIQTLSGSAYLSGASLLAPFALSMFFFAISQLFLNYFLAADQGSSTWTLFALSLVQPLLLYLSSHTISTVVYVNLVIHFLLLLLLAVKFAYGIYKTSAKT